MDGERIESDSHESTLSITIVTKIGQRSARDQLQILKKNSPRQGRRNQGGVQWGDCSSPQILVEIEAKPVKFKDLALVLPPSSH